MDHIPIAVIGVACRFPDAPDYHAFWTNLIEEREAPGVPGAGREHLVGRLLPEVDRFDARFFSISDREARAMDPQQRLLLEECWHAIEDSGVPLNELRSKRTAVFAAAMTSDFLQQSAGSDADSYAALGAYHCILANRVSHVLGLNGPSFAIDAGHASSLVALHQAVQSLRTGEANYALVGGVNVILSNWKSDSFTRARMLSPDRRCKPFDAGANGYVPAEGAGVVLLQRRDDARREGNSIRGIISGSAVNHSGPTASITAPDAAAQASVIAQAYAAAGVSAGTVTYVEAHGTGTAAGDPAEIDGLRRVFAGQPRRTPCLVGSVKSNIGHLEAAAGIAGVIKVLLMLEHRRVPRSLHIEMLNPALLLDGSNLRIATEAAEWCPAKPRMPLRAGVSSFGFGGVNAHVLIEAPPLAKRHAGSAAPRTLILSARTGTALAALVDRWRAFAATGAFQSLTLDDIARTLAGREAFPHRLALRVQDAADLARALAGDPQSRAEPDETPAPVEAVKGRRVPLPCYPFEGKPLAAAVQSASQPASPAPAEHLRTTLKSVIARVLQCEPESIGGTERFQESLGVDSFANVEIVEALEKLFGPLPRTLLFEHYTVDALVAHLAGRPAGQVALPAPDPPRPDPAPGNGIAIVGLAGRFAQSPTVDALWKHLAAGESCITEVPPERWDAHEFVDPAGKDSNRSYTRWGGFLDGHDRFDPLFFRISPKQAEQMDPQQRVFLETARAAMEDAGYTPASLSRNTGVFAGVSTNTYALWAAQAAGDVQTPDTDLSDVANRVSWSFDLHGPSISVDTACSASLTALHLAVQSLRRGECEVAFVGGVNLTLHPNRVLQFCRKEMLLHGPDCHPFGEGPGGFVDGEGVCVVLLKPLAAAIADRDHIYAVIKGSAVNSEGRTSGYTVPSPERQASLMHQALRDAGVDPRTISYVEAHGTGTRLGDPIEIDGLSRAFRSATDDTQFCAIGSLKSNIGHLIAAAGIAGVAKVLLQMKHRTLVPSLHAGTLNPFIDFAATPFVVQRSLAPWQVPAGQLRRAGVSSFGSGGSNAHVILEEYPDDRPLPSEVSGPVLVRLSARGPERLQVMAANLAAFLNDPGNRDLRLADVAYTLRAGREEMTDSRTLAATSVADLADQLGRVARGEPVPDPPGGAAEPEGLRISLPTYPFLRQRYWLPVSGGAGAATLLFRPAWRPAARSAGAVAPPASHVMTDADDPGAAGQPLIVIAGPAEQALERAFLLAQRLAAQPGPVSLVYAYAGGDPRHRAVEALLHAAQCEAPQLEIRVLEAEPGDDLVALARLEFAAGAGSFIRYQRGGRLVRGLEPIEPGSDEPFAVRGRGAWVLTGGAGGLGLIAARHLIDRGARQLVLLGRSAPADVAGRLRPIEAAGAEILYLQADVADRLQLGVALSAARRRFGAIEGVVHAAGIKPDGAIRSMHPAAAATAFAAKVQGTLNLDAATRDDPLDWFVLFSSIAALLHGDGVAAYAGANGFLGHFAAARTGQGPGRTLAVDWPFWRGGGMTVPPSALEAMRAESGLVPMPVNAGLAAWDAAMQAGVPNCTVLHGDATRILAAVDRRFEGSAHVRQLAAMADAGPLSGSPAASAADSGPTAGRLLHWVREQVAAQIGLPPRDIDPATGFAAYGVDSVSLRHIHRRLEARFGPLPVTMLLECTTVEMLARRLSTSFTAEPAAAAAVISSVPPRDDIAIIGISGRYPQAGTIDELWNNLLAARTAINPVPRARWDAGALFDPNPARAAEGRIYCTQGAFLDDVDLFDPFSFELTPLEARQMHPEERLLLESTWRTLESAGYTRAAVRGRPIGVFVGVNALTYPLLAADAGQPGEISPDTSFHRLANRISYFWDWTGPSLPVDTGCSASLVAVHLACESIRSGECEAAIAGGVNLYLHPSRYVSLCRDRLLATRAGRGMFPREGDGFVPGEGVGTVLLKPLSRALADGDTIQAVIRASGVAHKGRSNGFLAPSPRSQAALLRDVLARAHVDPATIGYIEVQAIGAEMADAAEWQALTEAYGGAHRCAVGSLEPNIGHLEAASGMAQLAKVVQQLRHGRIAPVLAAAERNQDVRPGGTPFFLPAQPCDWAQPRRAAISSLAAGGTAAHLVLEYYPAPPTSRTVVPHSFEKRRCWLRGVTEEPSETPAGGVVADYYNRMTDALRQTLGVEDEIYVLFAPFPERVAGFSWLKAFFDPLRGRQHLDRMLAGQKALKAALYRHVDFSRVHRVMDIGCGLATDLIQLARAHPQISGDGFTITPRQAETGAERVRRAGLSDRINIHLADSTARPFPGTYDLVIGFEVIFHIENKDAVFANIARHLGPDGCVVLADGVTNTVTEIDMPHLGQFTATAPQFAEVLARNRLRIDDCIDCSREIGNFLYDSDFEANLAEINTRFPALAAVADEHRCWDSFGKTLTQGLVRYLLFSIRKAPAGEPEAALARWNEARIREALPYREQEAPSARGNEDRVRGGLPYRADDAQPAPVLPIEEHLLQLAARTLEIEAERIDPEARFVDYGVGSLQGLMLLEAVNRELGLQLKMPVLYDHSSIRDLARHVERLRPTRSAPAPAATTVATPDSRKGIAVIGMAGRFPGADNVFAFWQNLRNGVDSVGEIPLDRWDAAAAYDPDPGTPGRSSSRWAGLIRGVDEFDAGFFRISRREADVMDPQQRLFLQSCWGALEDAGYPEDRLSGRKCGIYAGIMGSDYACLLREAGAIPDAHTLLGNDDAALAARIAYILDLKGPALTLKTACSSSLVAVHLACRGLLHGEADLMLAGGVTLYLHPDPFAMMTKAGMLSPSGRCRPFDDAADGIAVGDGCGVVVLKRLADALADGDRIYGVIEGSAVNQDGRTNGMTAPSMRSQVELELDVYRAAGISPETIDYVEAHGTGTRLGDPIEVAALTEAFRRFTPRTGFCGIGSVKGNIGHTTAAAGVAGLIKVLLGLKAGEIPPTLHSRTPNSHIDFAHSPFFLVPALRRWEAAPGKPRRAAVSAFGYTGTNCHLVVAEPPPAPPRPGRRHDGPVTVTLSARTEERLKVYAAELLAFLRSAGEARPAVEDIAWTLQSGRSRMACAATFTASNPAELEAKLGEYLRSGRCDAGAPETVWTAADRPRRVSLPTYPFAPERHWVPGQAPKAAAEPALQCFRPVWRQAEEPAVAWTGPVAVAGDVPEGDDRPSRAAAVAAGFPRFDPSQAEPVGAILHLGGSIESAIELARTLTARPVAEPVRVLSVYRDGDPSGAALSGFARSINRETSRVVWRTLGLRGQPALAASIRRELSAADAVDVLRADDGRFRRELTPLTLPAAAPALDGGVYLITGGAGGLGRIVAGHLRAVSRAQVLTCGRSTWADPDHFRTDVRSRDEVRSLIARIRQRYGRLDGIIHAAGVLDDRLMADKSAAAARDVISVKVDGARWLDEATRDEPLRFFAMFSSAAGVLGNAGQTDYAYGNAFLDAFAEWREAERQAGARQGITLSIAWPLWAEGGMQVSPEVRQLLAREFGLTPLATRDGLAILDAAVGGAAGPRVIVANGAVPAFLAAFNAPLPLPQPASPNHPPPPDLRAATERMLRDFIAGHIGSTAEAIDPIVPLEEYGFDSLMIHGFNRQMEKLVGPFSRTIMFECRTVAQLADYLVRHHAAELAGTAVMANQAGQSAGHAPADADRPRTQPDNVAAEASPSLAGVGSAGPAPGSLPASAPAGADAGPVRAPTACESPAPAPGQSSPLPRSAADAERPGAGPPRPGTRSPPSPAEPIAIIGVSGRYPQAPALQAFWSNLQAGRECIADTPPDRWDAAKYRDRIYCSRGGFLDGVDRFEPLFFGISPRDAEKMDPQERLFLEVAWSTLEDAGYTPRSLGRKTGVFVGITTNTYCLWGPDAWRGGEPAIPESMAWSAANRVSFCFDFNGPSMPVDTACSSSLSAIHLACESLRKGECQAALAGGVNLYLHPAKYVQLCQLNMLSRIGHCHSFGVEGDGFVPGEGVGAVLLKPLSKAMADGDNILAVVRGSAINHGGRTNGYTVPNPEAQAAVIEAALRDGGMHPRQISYVEAHGTGTMLGDPVEIAGLTKAYAPFTADRQYCAIGSVKSNIGHLEAAAGIAGLTKILLQMRHGRLVPSLHAARLNPNIDFAATPFVVQQTVADWPEPRVAAISSFGAGGANAHLIVEGYQPVPAAPAPMGPFAFVLSGRTVNDLRNNARRLLDALMAMPEPPAAGIAWTLQTGREPFSERLAIVAAGIDGLRSELAGFLQDGRSLRVPASGGEVHEAAARWMRGETVDWLQLYPTGAPGRVPLPGHEFNGRRYWVTIPQPGPDMTLHPLIDRNTSTARQLRFVKNFPARDSRLLDMAVAGRSLLPLPVLLEMARAAAALAGEREVHRIFGFTVVDPLFPGDTGGDVQVLLTPAAGVLEFEIRHGESTYLRGRASGEAGRAADTVDIEAVRQRCPRRLSGAELYRSLEARGTRYGPALQPIRSVVCSAIEALAELDPPSACAELVLHPVPLTGAFQALGVWEDAPAEGLPAGSTGAASHAPSTTGAGNAVQLAIDAVEISGAAASAAFAYVRRHHDTFDLHLLGGTGTPLAALLGLRAQPALGRAVSGLLEVLQRLERGQLNPGEARRLIDVTHA
nr:SDR family NAD(P)-dependent oxidoreductase [uncultured Rhodopila sp.]